jgi:hypothetical protein
VEQTAVYECKRLGESKLCNATRFESISRRPTLADNRDVLEHRNAAKQHLVHRIRGMHKGDFERGMLKQRPMLDITRSNGSRFEHKSITLNSILFNQQGKT